MKKIVLLIISAVLNFLVGISILFVAFNVLLFINGFGVKVGEILLMIACVFLLIVPNKFLYKKASDNKKLYIIISLISFIFGFIGSINIFRNWN